MAIFNALYEFLDDEAMVGTTTIDYEAAGTGKTLDFGAAGLEMGAGSPVWFNARVGTTAYVGGTSIQVILLSDDTSVGHDASSTEVLRGPVVLITAATAGGWLCRVPLPYNVDQLQYLGVGVEYAGAVTSGTIDAWLDHGPQSSYDTQVTTSNI